MAWFSFGEDAPAPTGALDHAFEPAPDLVELRSAPIRRGAKLGLLVFLICACSLAGFYLLWTGASRAAALGFFVVYEEAMRVALTDATFGASHLPRALMELGAHLLRCGAGAGFVASAIYCHRRLSTIR